MPLLSRDNLLRSLSEAWAIIIAALIGLIVGGDYKIPIQVKLYVNPTLGKFEHSKENIKRLLASVKCCILTYRS
jgi:hypothetical protein